MKDKLEFTKIQELVYELRASDAMKQKLITISPETRMSELRALLRDNRISGTPVVEDGKLKGIVSLEDFINWLADGACQTSLVKEKMTKGVETVYADEPLVQVMNRFDQHGFGRLPVLERETEMLKGIITKGDIIEKLLHKLHIDFRDEEIQRYRASHFFEDMIADSTSLNLYYGIKEKKIEDGGQVASSLKKTLRRLGIHPEIVRRAAILLYEAEMNIIIYAKDGDVTVTVTPQEINIKITDKGPGIPDIEKAMQPGYSTAPEWVREYGFGAGMGLQNIKECSDSLNVDSVIGKGTSLTARLLVAKECA